MNILLKNLGILVILAGVVVLIITVTNTGNNNAGLVLSGVLVVVGLVVHILMNRQVS